MNATMLIDLAHNAALLIALALVSDLLADRVTTRSGPAGRDAMLGIAAGTLGIAVMLTPWEFGPGIAFDTRSVLLAVTGLYFGALPASIAMAMTAAARLLQGGDGALTGVAVIVASGSIGLAWRHAFRERLAAPGFANLLALGFAVHFAMLAILLTLPGGRGGRVVSAVALPVLAIYPLATALLGSLLASRLRLRRLAGRLQRGEERLRLALVASRQGLFDIDFARDEVLVTGEYGRAMGGAPGTSRESIAAWRERAHPDDRKAALAAFEDHVAGRTPDCRAEFRVRAAGGDWHWILSVGRVIERDGDGRPLRMLGTHADVTERRLAEGRLREAETEAKRLLAESDRSRLALLSVVEDLRSAEARLGESEAFYRGLFLNMHEGFAYCRIVEEDGVPVDWVYLRVNESFERMRGVKDAAGRRASETLLDFDRSAKVVLTAYGRVAGGDGSETLEVQLPASGRWFLVVVYSPQPGHFVASWVDITDRKRAELEAQARLEELDRWYRATLGREGRVLELKAEVNELRRRLGEPPRYRQQGATATEQAAATRRP
jgi:PAS domain-containing protein